jgi:hypothetical protein
MKAAEMTDEKVKSATLAKTYGIAIVFMLIAAVYPAFSSPHRRCILLRAHCTDF